MAHPEMEAVEVTDVSSAANALSQMEGIFGDEEERKPQEETQEDIQDEPDEDIAPDEASDEDLDESQADEQDAELEEEAIQAPVSWSEKDKQIFANAPPELQEVFLRRAKEQDTDYQRKTTGTAEQKKALDATMQSLEQERLKYADSLAAQINQAMPEKPSVELLDPSSPSYNPEQYHLQKAQFDDAASQQQAAMQKYNQTMQEQQKAQQDQFQAFVNEQNEILMNDLPEWSQDGFKDNILSYATDNGYMPEQLQQASAQDIKTLTKAMKWDALMAKKPGVKDKVRSVPKVAKPGVKQGQSAKYEAKQARFKKLRASGSLDDAAAVLGDLL